MTARWWRQDRATVSIQRDSETELDETGRPGSRVPERSARKARVGAIGAVALVAVLAFVAAGTGAFGLAHSGAADTPSLAVVATASPSASPSPATVTTERLLTYSAGSPETFQYPASWRIISGYWSPTRNSPAVSWAVGTGDFNLGCRVSETGVSCVKPSWIVPDDGVVVAWYRSASNPAFSIDSPLGSSAAPGYMRVNLGGEACRGIAAGTCLPADMIESPTGLVLYFNGNKISVLEARWGSNNAERSRAQVLALIDSWRLTSVNETPSP
jgi:hypothetical protein